MESRKSEFKNTLSLVSMVKYSEVYQELKDKYKDMVKVILGKMAAAPPHLNAVCGQTAQAQVFS